MKYSIYESVKRKIGNSFFKFIKQETGEEFKSFKESTYINKEENYKYQVSQEAKDTLDQKHWKETEIGKGIIQGKIYESIKPKLHYNYQWHKNNLIDWRKKDDFKNRTTDKTLEQVLFDFYKNKIQDNIAFERLLDLKLPYQFIAYLFFIKNPDRYLPITQERFDEVFVLLDISDFKTSHNASWENYLKFISIIKEVKTFLCGIDSQATLIDAHSFLYIFSGQMKKAKFPLSFSIKNTQDQTNNEKLVVELPQLSKEPELLITEDDEEKSFLEGKEKLRIHKFKERNKQLVETAKALAFNKDKELRCNVCGFSFVEKYGRLGFKFIEAHHTLPIKSLTNETEIKVEDMTMVCSNCHRMLHRKSETLAIDELKAIIIIVSQ